MKKFLCTKSNKNAILKRILCSALAGSMTLALTACGNDGEAVVSEPAKEYVYIPEYIELNSAENQYYSNIQMVGNDLIYSYYQYDEETMTGGQHIFKMDMEAGSAQEEISLALNEQQNVSQFVVDENGNVYASVYEYPEPEDTTDMDSKQYLMKFDAQGNVVYSQDITEMLSSDDSNGYIQSIAVDKEGRLYAQASELIRLFDADGNYKGDVKLDSGWMNAMGVGKDGKMYVAYYDYSSSSSSSCVADIDFDGKKFGTVYKDFPNCNSESLTMGLEKDFLVNDGESLMEYDCASQTSEELLDWLDCDINGSYVQKVVVTESGKLLAIIQSWGENSTMEVAILNKVKASEVSEKTTVTIGTMYSSQTLTAAAVAFNKSNDTYRVTIKNYFDVDNYTDTSYEDAMTNLNNDIVSGSNCPDILDMSTVNIEQMVQKGAVEDLTPYLEASSVLNKDDFIPSIIDAYTFDGVLATIPKSFVLSAIAGKTSEVGEELGWSITDIMAYAAEHPDAALFDGVTKSEILNYCMMFNNQEFVDWTTGECHFDSEEFRTIMEFVNQFPSEYDWSADDDSTPIKLQSGKVLLSTEYISEIRDIQLPAAMFDEPATFIGFPTLDGEPGVALQASDMFGIASKSTNKEGAWQFLEFYMNYEDDVFGGYGFSTHQATLEQRIEDSIKEDYQLDEDGNIVYDENGEPIVAQSYGIGYGDWDYDYHPVTEEEVETFKEILQYARPVSAANDKIMEIIIEEGEAYFSGQKSVDEVLGIIQSRVQIYVSENS